ncbi:hypothetical protein EIN_181540 [Entamoeba invadens IP1]|uniref:hypothetical protein n=1 Tax=Entamoeba invadens IP1 TaxID=370355 RepID=UPI0002C3E510|nr:hypothetical protein EIN_181540 [Entamoeba invadens IP1]ELP93987.1 hypothetical protein EIN_181540 [Entamoeba invadens IP1]|eukprot:XP_004260758.1 hypothetical protein EIN_181540 [Entamoeba invadens IP1]
MGKCGVVMRSMVSLITTKLADFKQSYKNTNMKGRILIIFPLVIITLLCVFSPFLFQIDKRIMRSERLPEIYINKREISIEIDRIAFFCFVTLGIFWWVVTTYSVLYKTNTGVHANVQMVVCCVLVLLTKVRRPTYVVDFFLLFLTCILAVFTLALHRFLVDENENKFFPFQTTFDNLQNSQSALFVNFTLHGTVAFVLVLYAALPHIFLSMVLRVLMSFSFLLASACYYASTNSFTSLFVLFFYYLLFYIIIIYNYYLLLLFTINVNNKSAKTIYTHSPFYV